MKAMSKQQDGVALCYRKSEHFEVKETVKHGPNAMAFQLKMGSRQYYAVGAYILPPDLITINCIRSAWKNCPNGCTPWLLGNLNFNLVHPNDKWEEEIVGECRYIGIMDTSHHFDRDNDKNGRDVGHTK